MRRLEIIASLIGISIALYLVYSYYHPTAPPSPPTHPENKVSISKIENLSIS